jgi:hypothetical protein
MGTPFTTMFSAAEDPISEYGRWVNNALDFWTPVQTIVGRAYGTNGAKDTYDDSFAHLQGYGPNVQIIGIIHRAGGIPAGETHEIELLHRFSSLTGRARGYEFNLNYLGSMQAVRWNGAPGDFTVLSGGGSVSIASGDEYKVRISGTAASVYYNNNLIYTQTGLTDYSDGNPGIGFFKRVAGTNDVFGFSSITVTPL